MGEGPVLLCGQLGQSMAPTLGDRDLLEVAPYQGRKIGEGDLVLFQPPLGAGERLFVHRAVRVTRQGICTRGDNRCETDPWLLQPAQILGRVVAVWRDGKRHRIVPGRAGWGLARVASWKRDLVQRFTAQLRPVYQGLASSGILRPLLPSRLRPRVVVFENDADGSRRLRLQIGRWLVGRYDPHTGRWSIRRPFRLFVDPGALPKT